MKESIKKELIDVVSSLYNIEKTNIEIEDGWTYAINIKFSFKYLKYNSPITLYYNEILKELNDFGFGKITFLMLTEENYLILRYTFI